MNYSAQFPWPKRRSVEVLKVVVRTRAWAVQSSELRVCAYHCFSRKEIQLTVFPIVKNAYCGAWSLTLGFFMDFRLLFWWSRAAVAGNSTSLCKGEIPEGTRLRFARRLELPESNLLTKTRARGKGISEWNVDRNCISSTFVFLVRTATPVSSR